MCVLDYPLPRHNVVINMLRVEKQIYMGTCIAQGTSELEQSFPWPLFNWFIQQRKAKKNCLYIQDVHEDFSDDAQQYISLVVYLVLSKNRPLGQFFLVVAMSVYIYLSIYISVCPLPMQFFSRPLIGPQVT